MLKTPTHQLVYGPLRPRERRREDGTLKLNPLNGPYRPRLYGDTPWRPGEDALKSYKIRLLWEPKREEKKARNKNRNGNGNEPPRSRRGSIESHVCSFFFFFFLLSAPTHLPSP